MPPKKQSVKAGPLAFLDAHPFVRDAVVDKVFGCIFGSALGHTIGLYTEFMDKAQIAQVYKSNNDQTPKFQLVEPAAKLHPDAHRSRFAPRAWTDDTDQALLIVLSYLHNYTHAPSGQSPAAYAQKQLQLDFAARIQVWIRQGLLALGRRGLGIGRLVGTVVSDKNYLDDPVSVATKQWIKGGYKDAPNGSLMRTHPIGIIGIGLSEEETWNLAVAVGHTTHVDPRCSVSCCILVALIRGLLRGEITSTKEVDDCLERTYAFVLASPALMNPGNQKIQTVDVKGRLHRSDFERYVYAKELNDLDLNEQDKIGYVYKCLGSAVLLLWQAMRSPEDLGHMLPLTGSSLFELLTTNIVLEGGGSDTNAAAACAVLGAYLGQSRLPAHWTQGLEHRIWLQRKAARLVMACGVLSEKLNLEGDGAVLADGEWKVMNKEVERPVSDDEGGESDEVEEEREQSPRKNGVNNQRLLEAIAEDVLSTTHQEHAALTKAAMSKAIAEATGARKEYLMRISEVREATEKALGSVGKGKTKAADGRNQRELVKEKTKKRKADAEVEDVEKETKVGSKANTKKSRVEPKVMVEKKSGTKKQKQPAESETKNRAVKTGQRVLHSAHIANQKK